MATVHMLGPADHGRKVSRQEFEATPWEEGYRYELIDGRLYVSPTPELPHETVVDWLDELFRAYKRSRPDVVNFVATGARVFVPGRRNVTAPQPDFALYQDFPHHVPIRERRWRDVSPLLVVEVVSEDDPEKDLVRNVELYEQVPSVREYWIFDQRSGALAMRVYRRRGARWQKPIEVPFGGAYTTKLLPGFALTVDPLG